MLRWGMATVLGGGVFWGIWAACDWLEAHPQEREVIGAWVLGVAVTILVLGVFVPMMKIAFVDPVVDRIEAWATEKRRQSEARSGIAPVE